MSHAFGESSAAKMSAAQRRKLSRAKAGTTYASYSPYSSSYSSSTGAGSSASSTPWPHSSWSSTGSSGLMNSHRGSNDADAARVRTGADGARGQSGSRGETRSQNSQPKLSQPKYNTREIQTRGEFVRRATDEETSLTSNLEAEHVEEPLRGHLQGHAPRRSALVRVGASAAVVVREPLELLAQDVSRAAKRFGAAEHERGGERRRGPRQVHVHAVAEEHRRGPVRLGVAADGARRGDGRREQRQHGERRNGFRSRHFRLAPKRPAAAGVAGTAGTNSSACAGPLRAIRGLSELRLLSAVLGFARRRDASSKPRGPRARRTGSLGPPNQPGTPHRH